MSVYEGYFSCVEDIEREFQEPGCLDGCEVLYASYELPDYEGDAFVVFRKDGQLYEVNGGHCSCYGLEEQWQPEETSVEAIMMRSFYAINKESVKIALGVS